MAQLQPMTINGVDVTELREYIESCRLDASQADRNPVVVARWVGGGRAEVTSSLGGPPVYMGGEDDPSALGMLLRSLAACDVEVVATKAALLGVEIEDLSVEARGYANVNRYLGLESEGGPGYQRELQNPPQDERCHARATRGDQTGVRASLARG